MSKIPCRKCKQCGKYSDMASLICECGEDLANIPVKLVETSDLSAELIANIDDEIEVFVQKCSACGTLNFSLSESEPVKMCWNCHKTRIATVTPVKYICDEPTGNKDSTLTCDLNSPVRRSVTNKLDVQSNKASDLAVNEEEDDDDDASPWTTILSGIRTSADGFVSEKRETVSLQSQNMTQVSNSIINNDKDDDVDAENWENILGRNTQRKEESQIGVSKGELTIIAVRYGKCSYTIKKTEVPLLLGRDAKLKEFLAHDPRVSNEHLYIDYENNNWVVRDNNSSNGTAINSKDIGYGGKKIIRNGDLLKLGHHSDSMEFKVLIET